MGDRANVVVVDRFDTPPVYLYTHWRGYQMGDIVAEALSRRLRWDDGPYLARIVFCEMVRSDIGGETGFGIATSPPDNEHPYIVLDIARENGGCIVWAPMTHHDGPHWNLRVVGLDDEGKQRKEWHEVTQTLYDTAGIGVTVNFPEDRVVP